MDAPLLSLFRQQSGIHAVPSKMIEAMAEHIRVLRQTGQPVPEPSEADSVAILDPAAA